MASKTIFNKLLAFESASPVPQPSDMEQTTPVRFRARKTLFTRRPRNSVVSNDIVGKMKRLSTRSHRGSFCPSKSLPISQSPVQAVFFIPIHTPKRMDTTSRRTTVVVQGTPSIREITPRNRVAAERRKMREEEEEQKRELEAIHTHTENSHKRLCRTNAVSCMTPLREVHDGESASGKESKCVSFQMDNLPSQLSPTYHKYLSPSVGCEGNEQNVEGCVYSDPFLPISHSSRPSKLRRMLNVLRR